MTDHASYNTAFLYPLRHILYLIRYKLGLSLTIGLKVPIPHIVKGEGRPGIPTDKNYASIFRETTFEMKGNLQKCVERNPRVGNYGQPVVDLLDWPSTRGARDAVRMTGPL